MIRIPCAKRATRNDSTALPSCTHVLCVRVRVGGAGRGAEMGILKPGHHRDKAAHAYASNPAALD